MKLAPRHLLLLLPPFFLTNCATTTTGRSGSSTPSHNMSRSEYPFDENGNYHEEWVKGNDTTKVVDLTKNNPPSVFLGTTDKRDEDTPPATKPKTASSGGGKPASKPTAAKPTTKPAAKPVAKATPKPRPPAPKFTTVSIQKSDTLYGLAKKHGTSVAAIQAANGMGSSTNLRDGGSLKIPR